MIKTINIKQSNKSSYISIIDICNDPLYCLIYVVLLLLIFIVYCSLFIVYCLLFIIYYLLFIIYCLLFIVYCLLFIIFWITFIVVESFGFIEQLLQINNRHYQRFIISIYFMCDVLIFCYLIQIIFVNVIFVNVIFVNVIFINVIFVNVIFINVIFVNVDRQWFINLIIGTNVSI